MGYMLPKMRRAHPLAKNDHLGTWGTKNCQNRCSASGTAPSAAPRTCVPPEERYPSDFYTCTKSTATVVSLAGDTLKRLYKKDPSLAFIIEEGGNLISHPWSMTASHQWYEEKKCEEWRENVDNYRGWFATVPNSGSIAGGRNADK